MEQSSAVGVSVRLVLPSEIRLLDLVHSASERMAEIAGFDEDDALNIGLAMREAVVNAMIHGNHGERDREVRITMSAGADGWSAQVVDEGEGFDPEATADPTRGDNVLKTSGRGLMLMRAFVDDVRYRTRRGGGTELTLKKSCKPKPDTDPDANS